MVWRTAVVVAAVLVDDGDGDGRSNRRQYQAVGTSNAKRSVRSVRESEKFVTAISQSDIGKNEVRTTTAAAADDHRRLALIRRRTVPPNIYVGSRSRRAPALLVPVLLSRVFPFGLSRFRFPLLTFSPCPSRR